METILVVGATGNIGVSAVKAALNTGRNVIAVVRNQASTSKLIQHVGTSKGITIAEADVTSPGGVQSVVQRVREGQLPSFQHVYSSGKYALKTTSRDNIDSGIVGTFDLSPHITDVSTEAFRRVMNVNVEANFCEPVCQSPVAELS
jgi:NAD(P)-dependent dehydrogenase (short-subunit alcohol dehydrogenase family)